MAAFEILIPIPAVRNRIREGKTHQISSIMQTAQRIGMQTLDQSLAHLVHVGAARLEDARARASNLQEFDALVGSARKSAGTAEREVARPGK